VLSCLSALLGCSLFSAIDPIQSVTSKRSVLPPLQASPDAIQLEIFFLERPAEDPLLAAGPTGIWRDVDQIGALKAETRESLNENGFRIGHYSSNPPPSIQKLLGWVSEITTESQDYARPLMGRHQFLAPGIETEIPTGIEREQCEFVLRDKDDTKTFAYEKVCCVMRMKAHRLQDGWVRVDFVPEIHHGDRKLRPTYTHTEGGMSYKGGQNVDALLTHRFSVTMNVGETMLMTSNPDADESLGDRFFCHEVGGTENQRILKKQRILLIKIVDAGKPQSHR